MMKLIEIEGGLLALMRFNFAALKIGCYFPASSFSVYLSVSFGRTPPGASEPPAQQHLHLHLQRQLSMFLHLNFFLKPLVPTQMQQKSRKTRKMPPTTPAITPFVFSSSSASLKAYSSAARIPSN